MVNSGLNAVKEAKQQLVYYHRKKVILTIIVSVYTLVEYNNTVDT